MKHSLADTKAKIIGVLDKKARLEFQDGMADTQDVLEFIDVQVSTALDTAWEDCLKTSDNKLYDLWEAWYDEAQERRNDFRGNMGNEYGLDYAEGVIKGIILSQQAIDELQERIEEYERR